MASSQWPMWQQFKKNYISSDGRVIDASTPKKITTSEGQSYGLFFALVAQDKSTFNKLLEWTENNLAQGNLALNLPAWEWGMRSKNKWGVLDKNSAADADLWMAYDLLEAGRIWNNARYSKLGKQLLQQIYQKEVRRIPGLGPIVLPGAFGFNFNDYFRLNPSYLPLQLLARFSNIDPKWQRVEKNAIRLLLETSSQGFSPDWVVWKINQGWGADKKHPNVGSFDAIRVYLWAGMLSDGFPFKLILMDHFNPMVQVTQKLGFPPESVNTVTGQHKGTGPLGFSAAMLPMLAHNPSVFMKQKERLALTPLKAGEYYSSVLRLFGQGWAENIYQFNANGELLLGVGNPITIPF